MASLLFISIATFAAILGNFEQIRGSILASILPNELVVLTNQTRIENKLPALISNPFLNKAAQLKADDMAKKEYFAHNSPEGKTPWDWLARSNYDFLYAGENLAVNFTESVDVERAWLNSQTHRDNILDKQFTEIGIATAEGMYKGNKATYVVQMFGTPMPESKTAYLGEILKKGEAELSTLSASRTWRASGEMELYITVKKIEPLKVNSAAYNRLLNKILFLLDSKQNPSFN